MSADSKPHSEFKKIREALTTSWPGKFEHLRPGAIAALDGLEEQNEALRVALRGVIEHVEDSFQGGTFVDPVFVIARKVLDGSIPASEAMPGKGPKAPQPRNTDSGMAVRVGPLASEGSSPASGSEAVTSTLSGASLPAGGVDPDTSNQDTERP